MKLPKISSSTGEFKVADEGAYKMEFTAYTEPSTDRFNENRMRFMMTFTIVEDMEGDTEFAGCEVRQFFSFSMHENSKLRPVVQALMGGAEIGEDDELELDELIGRRIIGTVTHSLKPRRDNPTEMARFANLGSATPIKKRKTTADAAVTRKQAWDDEDAA